MIRIGSEQEGDVEHGRAVHADRAPPDPKGGPLRRRGAGPSDPELAGVAKAVRVFSG